MSIFHKYPESQVSEYLNPSQQKKVMELLHGLAKRPPPRTGLRAPNSPLLAVPVQLLDGTWAIISYHAVFDNWRFHEELGLLVTYPGRQGVRGAALQLSLQLAPPEGLEDARWFTAILRSAAGNDWAGGMMSHSDLIPLRELAKRLDLTPEQIGGYWKDAEQGKPLVIPVAPYTSALVETLVRYIHESVRAFHQTREGRS